MDIAGIATRENDFLPAFQGVTTYPDCNDSREDVMKNKQIRKQTGN